MTRKQYKLLILAMQPGHLQEQHLWNREPAAFTLKHPSYKSILFKYKKAKLVFPQLKQPMLLCSFTKSAQGLRWRNAFPTVSPTPATGSEVWLETQGPREKPAEQLVVGTKLQWALLEPIRSSDIWGLGTWEKSVSAHLWALGNRNLGHVSPNYLVHII